MEHELDRWYRKLWETKGARFIAAHRLESHEKWSTITTSLISLYIISLNLLIIIPEEDRMQLLNDNNIAYLTICLSIFILIFTLIISSRNYKLRADKFHECGRKITGIYDKVCLWKNTNNLPTMGEIEIISSEYLNLLDKYENHNHFDFMMFKSNNLYEYKDIKFNKLFRLKVNFFYFIQTMGIYILAIFCPWIIMLMIYVKI